MTRAVLDTNVIVAAIAGSKRSDSPPREILARWRAGLFTLVVSDVILAELARTLGKPFVRRTSLQARAGEILALLAAAERAVVSPPYPRVAPDADDDHVIAAAVDAAADYLVTGDAALRSVGRYRGVTFVTPAEFLALLDAR